MSKRLFVIGFMKLTLLIDHMHIINTTRDPERLERQLSEFFSNIESITLAYLFGSTVRGESNCLSDIDIAILFDKTLTK